MKELYEHILISYRVVNIIVSFYSVPYNVDPAWYLTAFSFSLDVALKKYGENFELFNNTKEHENMYNFIEKEIRGGISNISHRHSIANNKYMKNFDPTNKSKYIVYLDANNLYGWAMQQKLSVLFRTI